jgi:hypothetical protein
MAIALIRNIARPDIILFGTLVLLTTVGVIDPVEAVGGFDNEGLVTVATMFIVVTGLSATGGMSLITSPLLGRPRSTLDAQTRLMLPVTAMSAFLNNTPPVAMFMPVVNDWCKKSAISPSKLFLPLSYAAILGGTCTLIGTSTNLVVNGLLLDHYGNGGVAAIRHYVHRPACCCGRHCVLPRVRSVSVARCWVRASARGSFVQPTMRPSSPWDAAVNGCGEDRRRRPTAGRHPPARDRPQLREAAA